MTPYADEARARRPVTRRRDLDRDADIPQHRDRHAVAVDGRATSGLGFDTLAAQPAAATFKESIGAAAYEEAGIGPEDVDVAEVYDLSTALELDWMEDLSLCKRGEAE